MKTKRLTALVTSLFIVLLLCFYAELIRYLPSAQYDFHIFYAAAQVLQQGGNPYDVHQLFLAEQRLYPAFLHNPAQRAWLQQNPYAQGPLLLIALLPTLRWLPHVVYPVLFSTLIVVTILSLGVTAYIWPHDRSRSHAMWLLISPIAFVGPFLGQVDALFLLAFVLALLLVRRDRYAYAGSLLTIGLIKPQIMIGAIILFAALAYRHKRLLSYLVGLGVALIMQAGLTAIFAGLGLIPSWLISMIRFGHDTVSAQGNLSLSSLTTLYLPWLPRELDSVMSGVLVLAWIGLCVWSWSCAETPEGEYWWLTFGTVIWLLVTPYAHPHDDVIAMPAVWLLCRQQLTGRAAAIKAAFLLAWWLCPLSYPLGLAKYVGGLSVIPIILLAVILYRQCPFALKRGHLPAAMKRQACTGIPDFK